MGGECLEASIGGYLSRPTGSHRPRNTGKTVVCYTQAGQVGRALIPNGDGVSLVGYRYVWGPAAGGDRAERIGSSMGSMAVYSG